MGEVLTANEVLDRIEAAFGSRPTTNALWLATSRGRAGTRSSAWRGSLTSGLPAPVTTSGESLIFDAAEVETWIEQHPARAMARLVEEMTAGELAVERAPAVGRARDSGLSWAKIAEAIADVDGQPVSRELVRQVFTSLLAEG